MAATKYDRGMPGLVAPMTLPPGEPAAGPWRAIREEDLVRVLFNAGSVSPRKPLTSIHRWGGLLSWRRNAEMPL